MQTIKERTTNGYSSTEIVDEVFSGFKAPVYTADQVLISNAHERNIQKHRFNIIRRYIEYGEAEAKYGQHENWSFVQPGIRSVYGESNGLFYDTKDDAHPFLVEETIYKNRRDDTEVCFVGGIYLGDTDVEANPIKHRDNRNAPKYNITPFGYYPIGQHFFFYKSMMNAVQWDNQLYDAMSELLMNRAILEVDVPLAVSGSDKIDSEIVFPSAVVAFADKETKITPMLPAANMAAGFNALMATKDSIDDGTLSDTQTGQLPEASQKAYSVAQAQANAKKLIAGVGKSLAASVVQYGPLMADIALNHLTIPEVDEITAGDTRLKYRKFILEKQVVDGKQVDKEIRFDQSLVGRSLTKQQADAKSLALLEETQYPEHTKHIRVVNPHLFSKFRYLCRIDPEEMFPKNSETMSALLSSLYQMLANDPDVEHKALLRKLLYSHFRGEGEELIRKEPLAIPGTNLTSGSIPETPVNAAIRGKQTSLIANNVGVV